MQMCSLKLASHPSTPKRRYVKELRPMWEVEPDPILEELSSGIGG